MIAQRASGGAVPQSLAPRALVALAALAAAAAASSPAEAGAAPTADVVIVWAPDHDIAPLAAAAREAGAAVIDRSPPHTAPISPDAAIRRGIDSYEALQLDRAWQTLAEVRAAIDRTGAAGASAVRLSDLFVYRAAILTQRGEADAAWEELVTALVVAPARVLDPARFAPRAVEELERARKAVLARPRVALALEAPAACAITVDGTPAAARELELPAGPHWVHAACPGSAPWGARVELVEPAARVRIAPPPIEPPPDEESLIQARTAGATGVVIAEVRGGIARLRRVGLDGRERDRRTVAVAAPSRDALVPGAVALRDLLRPRERTRWYQSRWVWAAGAAGLATAILLPIAAALADDGPRGVTIVGPGGGVGGTGAAR